jgi:hypothetical protein
MEAALGGRSTHISDQYAPFSTKVVNVGVRDSTYVLDGLLYHESDLAHRGTLHRHGGLHRPRLRLMHLWASASRRASATWATPSCSFPRAIPAYDAQADD